MLGGSVLVIQDVSEERRLESERAALREQLAQSETLSQLVAGIAHELNNPLQAVLGHIELLRHTERLSSRIGAALRQAYRESSRAARIVHNLLLLAGSGRFAHRPISVNAAVRRALALRAGPCRRAGIVIERRLDETLPRTAGDALLLQQAIHNLVINAEQAMAQPGGRIEISTAVEAGRNRIVLEIRDTGTGIPADVLPRVFEPFFTTKHSGSGLGLAVARRIIREHGGDIDAVNRPGGGARFRVHLPAAKMVR
jgi:signal transduction histidine kinase